MSKQDPKNASEVPLQMHRMRFYFGGESGIPVPGKPELFPNSGEVGGNTNELCPAAVGDSGMPESDVGKADCVGDISGFIPVSISLSCSNPSSCVSGLGLQRPGDDIGVKVDARVSGPMSVSLNISSS